MDGSSFTFTVQVWDDPRDKSHPHQRWLAAAADDRTANFAAYRAAYPDLADDVCEEVFALHDSAQYEFIKLLLWHDGGRKPMMSVTAALAAAKLHDQSVRA